MDGCSPYLKKKKKTFQLIAHRAAIPMSINQRPLRKEKKMEEKKKQKLKKKILYKNKLKFIYRNSKGNIIFILYIYLLYRVYF